MEKSTNPQADTFLKVMSTIPATSFAKLRFADHMTAAGTRKCKDLTMRVLLKYLGENVQIRPQQIVGSAMAKVFEKWLCNLKLTDEACTYCCPAGPRLEPAVEDPPQPYLDRENAFRAPNSQLINQNASERLLRLSVFRERATATSCNLARSKGQARMSHRELEFVNHEMTYISLSASKQGRGAGRQEPLRKGLKGAFHDIQRRLIQVTMISGKHEYCAAVRYRFVAHQPGRTRLYHLETLSSFDSSRLQFSAPVWNNRKFSNAQSSSTNCDSSGSELSPVLRPRTCQFEGELRLTFSAQQRLAWIELCLVSLTRDTSRLFGLDDLLEVSVGEVLGDIACN